MGNYIHLTTVSSEFEMELIKAKLHEAGIEVFTQSNDPDNMLPALDYSSGVKVYVLPDDLEKAEWLISNTDDDLTDDMETGAGD